MIEERRSSSKRAASSPPSPVFDLPAEAVHAHGERLVRLRRQGAERHAARLEAPHDLLRGLDRLERQRIDVLAEAQQAAQGGIAYRDVVDVGGKALVRGRRSLSACRVLKRCDRLGVPAVVLAAPAPGVDPAGGEQLGDRGRVGARVAVERLARDRVETHSLDPRGRAREVSVDDLLLDPDDLEDLRARVGADGRDPHLGEDLQEPLADCADHALLGVLRAHAVRQPVLAVKRVERLEHHIWVDCRGPGADQRGDVMDLAGLAGLDHEADLQTRRLAHEVVVHRARPPAATAWPRAPGLCCGPTGR